jgi:predicted DNA-binding protein with PD1-like motif
VILDRINDRSCPCETPVSGITDTDLTLKFVRIGTAEDFFPRLLEEFESTGAPGAALVAAVGSFSSVTYGRGFVDDQGRLDMEQVVVEDLLETGGLSGHLGYDTAGKPICHIHGLFVREDGRAFGGHMFAAKVMLTLEVTLLLPRSTGWQMAFEDPEPIVPMAIPRKVFRPHPV